MPSCLCDEAPGFHLLRVCVNGVEDHLAGEGNVSGGNVTSSASLRSTWLFRQRNGSFPVTGGAVAPSVADSSRVRIVVFRGISAARTLVAFDTSIDPVRFVSCVLAASVVLVAAVS
jgi:hypothetical protein